MKIGISALLYNIDEAINLCEEINEIKHIELGIDNLYECDEIYKYIDKLKELNISLSIHLPMELNLCENIEFIRQSWVRFVEEMNYKLKDLNICYYNLHLGYVISDRLNKNREKYLDISCSMLDNIINKTKSNISIENTYSNNGDLSNVGNKVYDFEYIFNKVENEKLWFCYDTGHNLINRDNYIDKLYNKMRIVHLSDNDGNKDIHIGINKGILDKKEVKTIIDLEPDFLILEINYHDIKESIEYIKDIKKEV